MSRLQQFAEAQAAQATDSNVKKYWRKIANDKAIETQVTRNYARDTEAYFLEHAKILPQFIPSDEASVAIGRLDDANSVQGRCLRGAEIALRTQHHDLATFYYQLAAFSIQKGVIKLLLTQEEWVQACELGKKSNSKYIEVQAQTSANFLSAL